MVASSPLSGPRRSKFDLLLEVAAVSGSFIIALGGFSASVNPLPGLVDRIRNGDSISEVSEMEGWACVEDALGTFPARTAFRLDVDDPFYSQRITEIGFPHVYFDPIDADYSLRISRQDSEPTASIVFSCPDFALLIDAIS